MASGVRSPPFARPLSLQSPCLLSQGVDRWFRPESDPPVLSQPGGASESSRDSPGGHLLPPGPASCPLPWQQLDSRSQGKAPPGLAQHSQTSGGGARSNRGPREAASRGPGRGGEQGPEPWSREGGRKDRDAGEGETARGPETKGGRDENQEGGRRIRRERDPMGAEAARLRKEGGKREEGEGRWKRVMGPGEGREAAGLERGSPVAQPCPAWPGPAPGDGAAATLGPYHEVSSAPGLQENKWCPR